VEGEDRSKTGVLADHRMKRTRGAVVGLGVCILVMYVM